jgi:septal ring factor EnvC (AmiA/AmiB activator)
MLLTTKLFMASSALTVLLLVVLATPALAETATQTHWQVADRLADFKSRAFKMQDEADTLQSHARNKRLSWQTHTHSLNALKDHVNEMGKALAELEAQKPLANDGHAMAIEHARPHLVAVAQNLTQAIELVNERRSNVHWAEYGEAVSNIYDHADALHTKLDTILDHENAKMRLEALDLQAASTEGS